MIMPWHVLFLHFVLRNNCFMESSLDIQIGGSHYKKFSYQPIQFFVDMRLDFIQGNIIKYVSRYKDKNGKQDLDKALHYAALGAELNPENVCHISKIEDRLRAFVGCNKLSDEVGNIIRATCYQDWSRVVSEIKNIHNV